jgi:class 3 adenylate cyclase
VTDSTADAEGLSAHAGDAGEIRRLTLFFADLVDSTALSTHVEPETYRLVVGRYREQVAQVVSGYDGHIGSTKGDGLLAVFGDPIAREDDARRAVQAGLEITREVSRLSDQSQRRFGFGVSVRVGVHWGLVYLDVAQRDFSGLAANVAAGISGCAPPGAVVVSAAVETLIRNDFQLEACVPAEVKGVKEPVIHYLVVSERAQVA